MNDKLGDIFGRHERTMGTGMTLLSATGAGGLGLGRFRGRRGRVGGRRLRGIAGMFGEAGFEVRDARLQVCETKLDGFLVGEQREDEQANGRRSERPVSGRNAGRRWCAHGSRVREHPWIVK